MSARGELIAFPRVDHPPRAIATDVTEYGPVEWLGWVGTRCIHMLQHVSEILNKKGRRQSRDTNKDEIRHLCNMNVSRVPSTRSMYSFSRR